MPGSKPTRVELAPHSEEEIQKLKGQVGNVIGYGEDGKETALMANVSNYDFQQVLIAYRKEGGAVTKESTRSTIFKAVFRGTELKKASAYDFHTRKQRMFSRPSKEMKSEKNDKKQTKLKQEYQSVRLIRKMKQELQPVHLVHLSRRKAKKMLQ